MVDQSSRRVALLAIRPKHAEAILEGRKKVELRRTGVNPRTTHVVVYATAPIRAIVGWFEIAGIDYGTPERIWNTYNGSSGLSKREFQDYFYGTNSAVAIQVGMHHRLEAPAELSNIPGVKRAPQSFQYLEESDVDWLLGDAGSRYRQSLLADNPEH